MRIVPLVFAPFLSSEDHECSDRIWFPARMFERWSAAETDGTVMIVSLEGIAACVYGAHQGPNNVIYAPTWMCEALRVNMNNDDNADATDDYIVPMRIHPPICSFMSVLPHTAEHLHVAGVAPEDVLAHGFEHYTCMKAGETVCLSLADGERMFVTITNTAPVTDEYVCIRSNEIEFDLAPPLIGGEEMEAETHSRPLLDIPPPGGDHESPLSTGTIPNAQPTREERRRLAAAAALRRQLAS